MSKRARVLLIAFFGGAAIPTLVWLHYALLRDDPAYAFGARMMAILTLVPMLPFVAIALATACAALHWRLRKPDVVIRVSAPPTALEAKFLEQDRRLERRERLKGDLFSLNGEIERFAADLTPDERFAWQNRSGPYGK